MTQSTYFNQVKNVLKVLQGYTNGIRFLLVMLLTLSVSANAWGAGTWTLVKDASTLTAGDKVIIVAKDNDFAMSTTQNTNNRGQVAVTKNGETLTYTTAVQELTLKDGKTSGTLAFYTGSGYLYAASSSKNYLKTETTLSANSSWTITIANTGAATIKATGSNTRNWLRYNSSNNPPIFSCYGSGQSDVCLYKYVEEQGGDEGGGETPEPEPDPEPGDADAYKLITSTAELEAGAKYVIGNALSSSAVFMSNATNTNNRKQTASITITDSQISATDEVLVLELGGTTGAWTFLTTNYTSTNGYLTSAASGSNNYCKVFANAESCSYFTISFTDNAAVITSTGRNERNVLRYNSSSSIFACYTSGQNPVYLYKLVEAGTPEKPSAPAFTVAGGSYYGTQSIEITCATAGANIYYTLDGSVPTSSSTPYTGAISISETKTLKAIAIKGENSSSITEATYTILAPLATMQEIFDKATAVGGTATPVKVTMNNWVVTGATDKNVYVTDGTKGFIIYKNDGGHGFVPGDVLSGTVACKVQLYNGSSELTELTKTTEGLTVTTGGTVTPVEVDDVNTLGGVNTGSVIKITGTCESGNVVAGVKLYGTLYTFDNLTVGNKYNVTGVYLQYGDVEEILPRKQEDIEEVIDIPTATIAIANITMEVGQEKAIEATITPDAAQSTVQYAITSGNEYITLDGTTITAVAAGTATITATIAEVAGEYYGTTKTFTVTVKPQNIAILPVTFNGGKADIENTLGMSQTGLSDDYGSAPKLKFNGAGDNVIVHFDSQAGEFSFVLKQNGQNAGTFTVYESANGEDYTPVWSGGDFGNEQSETIKPTLSESARYVKFEYTTKGNSTNYALGSISIAKPDLRQEAGLVWNPSAVTLTQGDAFTAPTLNNPYSVAGITYESNNTNVATVTDAGIISLAGATGEATITASFAGNEDYKPITVTCIITVSAPPHTITWNAGGATYTTTVVDDGAAVELPDINPSSCSDKYTTFVGWYTEASGMESNPSPTPQGEKVTASTVPTDDAIYFAVWADAGASGGEWEKVTSFEIGDVVIFVNETSSKEMSDINLINSNTCGIASPYTTNPVGTYPLTIEAGNNETGYSFKTSDNKYLSWSSGNTLIKSETKNDASSWTIHSNTDGNFKFANIGTAERIMQYNTSTPRWACYTSTQTTFQIYKQASSATGYISSCCQSPAVVSVTPANANLELDIDGTASTTVNISQTGGGNGKYYEPTVSPADGASLDWAALGVGYKQTPYDINFTATKAGTYTVTGNFTETAAGCSKTGSATINVAANPILQVSEPTITSECGTEGAPVAVQIDSRYLTGASLTAQVATTTDTEHGVFKICTTEDGDFATTDLTGLSAGKDDKATVTIYVRYDAALDNIDAATGTLTITDGTTSQTIDLATTPICGTSIRMTPTDANSVRVTTANGQWTRTQTPIHLRGSYLLQNLSEGQGAKVELTSSNPNFKFVKPDVASSGTTKYESEKITNNTWEADVHLVYTPTTYNANETTIITAKVITFGGTKEHATATMTAYGRSFPETFVLALNTGSEWVALPADMIAPYGGCETGVGTHDPYPITVDNDANPTAATLAPARAVYKGAARNTPMTNPWTIQFESNTQAGYYLFGSNNTNTTIANTEQATGEGVKWELATEDNVTYQLSQTTTTNGQKLGYNGTNKTMGQYQSSASNFKYDFRILPVTATCTYYIEPVMTLEDFTDTEAKVRIQYDGTNLYQISMDNKANWTNIEGEIDCLDLTFTLNSTYCGKDVWLKPQGDLCEEVVSSVACHIPAPVITNPGAQAFKGTKNTDFAGVFTITGTDLYEDVSAIYIKANSNPAIGVAINNGEVTVTMNAPAVGTYTTNLTFDAVGANEVTVPVTIEIQDLAVQEFDGGNGAFVEVDGVNVLCKDLIDGGITPEIYLSYPLFYEGNGIIETSQLNNTSFSLVEIETGEELSIIRGVPSEFNASVTLEATTLSKMIPGHTYRLSWENTNQVMTNEVGLPYMDCYMDFVYSENCDAPTALLACPITNSGFTANWVPKEDCTDNVTVDVYTRGAETTLIEKTTFSTTEVKDLQYAGESNLSGNYWITNIEGTKGGAPSISSNRLLISDVSEAEYYNLFSPLLSQLGTISESTIYTITVTLYQQTADPVAGAYFYVMDNGNSLTKNTTPTITDKYVTIDGQTTTYKKLTNGTTTFTVKGLSSDDRIRLLGFKTSNIASKSKNVYISSIKIEASGSINEVDTKTISCNAGSVEFTGLDANTQYYYTVTDGSSNTSNEIAVTTYSGERSLAFYSDEECTENITETLVLGGEETTVYVSGTYVPGCEINTAVSSGYSMDDSGLIYTPTTGSVTGSIVLTLSDVNTTEGTLTLTDGKGNAYVLNINSSNCPTGFGSMALAASNINKTTATAKWNNALTFGSPKSGTLHLYKNGEVNVEKIVNGDFETGSLEQGWSNTIHTGEGYQDVDAFETYIVKTNNDAHEGGSYLYVSEEGSGNKYDDFHDMPILYADYVDLLPGRYQMKAWAKMKPANGYNDKQQQFALGLISGDKNSRTIVCKSETMLVTSNNTYVELTYEFELQSIVRACPVIGVKRDAGDFIPFYIDDVSLKRIKCPERGDEVQTIDIADLSAASSLDLTDLTPATEYTYVIQNAADCSSNEITFATDYSAIVQVHFSEDGTITSVPVDAETHKVTFEPTQSCAGRIFVGWSRDLVALTQTEPVGLVDLENETFTETTLLYAVYKSANGGKGNGISQVAFTEQFTGLAIYDTQNQNTVKTVQTQYTEWEYCYGRTRESYNANSLLGHVDLMFYGTSSTHKNTQAYLRTTQKIEGLSQLSLYARVNSNVGNTFHVQVSEDGIRWTDVADRIIPGKDYTQYIITLPTPIDAYIRIITTPVNSFASDATLNIDDIEIQTQARQFFYSDYATTCEGASSVAMTFDLNGGTAPTGKESDYEPKTTANTWHTLPAAPKKGDLPFLGWKVIDVPGYEMTFDAGEKYLLNHNVTLQAQWPTTEGDLMDIVDWNTNSVTINMNGYTISPNISYAVNGGETNTLVPEKQNKRYSFQQEYDRTYDIATPTLTPGESLQLSVTMGSDHSNQYYRVPYIYNASQTLPNTLTADDDIVVRQGCLTIEGEVQVNAIYVYPTAELRIAGGATLTANTIYMRTNAFQSAVLTDNGTLNVGQLYYTRIVADKQNSFLLALPFQSAIADMRLTTGETKTYDKQWVLYTYDAAQRAQTGATGNNWVKQSSITHLQPHTSYELLSGSAYYREYCFPVAYTKTNANVDISVTAHTGAAAQADPIHGGWNAIASPYTQNIQPQWGAPEEAIKLTRLLDDNKTYYQYVPTIIEPATAFYYQTAQNATLQFTPTTLALQVPQAIAAKVAQREETDYPTQWISLSLTKQNQTQDETHIYVHPNKFDVAYETNYDLTKMMGYGNRAQCYTTMPCGKLSFNALPSQVAANGVSVGVYAPMNDSLTIAVKQNEYIQNVEQLLLLDHYTNQTTDLLHTSYRFAAIAGEEEQRFTLFVKCRATAITTGNEAEHHSQAYAYTQPKKLFLANLPRGGNIVIYDAVGKQLIQQRITQTLMDFVLPTGNYYVKVVNESGIQIIPTIVK